MGTNELTKRLQIVNDSTVDKIYHFLIGLVHEKTDSPVILAGGMH
jgi:hypothetical protein